MVDRATCSHAARDHELDEIPSILAHAISPWMMGVAASCCASPRVRIRYQIMIVNNENTKMIVDTALISGVMPRRRRDHISNGKVFSRPTRKKLTAISSIESVKINSAAPMIDSFRLGRVMRQK